jgi:ABC-type lipoprotein export system ATPase subunit
VILALIYILRNQIVAYIKKKYNLFDEQEVISQINLAVKENNKRKSILKELENRQNEIKSNRNQNS